MPRSVGVIAGNGEMPERVIAACRSAGCDPFVLGLEGQADPAAFSRPPDAWIRLDQIGEGIRLLRAANVRDIVLAGGVDRPPLASLRPDAWTARLLRQAGDSYFRDGAILGLLAKALEAEGFRVVAAEAVAASLASEARLYTARAPNAAENADIARGLEAACALGALDIGQGVIVQQGRIIGVEAAEGTDALIERCGPLLSTGEGGVLVKACKPGQDRRIDLPTIGPRTVANAVQAGLAGIAVEAGRTLIVDSEAVVRAADTAGLFVIGVSAPE